MSWAALANVLTARAPFLVYGWVVCVEDSRWRWVLRSGAVFHRLFCSGESKPTNQPIDAFFLGCDVVCPSLRMPRGDRKDPAGGGGALVSQWAWEEEESQQAASQRIPQPRRLRRASLAGAPSPVGRRAGKHISQDCPPPCPLTPACPPDQGEEIPPFSELQQNPASVGPQTRLRAEPTRIPRRSGRAGDIGVRPCRSAARRMMPASVRMDVRRRMHVRQTIVVRRPSGSVRSLVDASATLLLLLLQFPSPTSFNECSVGTGQEANHV